MRDVMRSGLLLGMVLACSGEAATQDKPAAKPFTHEQLAVFALLDKIDATDTSKLSLVRVSWPRTKNVGNYSRLGFIVRIDEHATRVRHLDGSHSTIASDIELPGYGKLQPLDLNAELHRMIRVAATKDNYPDHLMLRILLLARAAARTGERELVHLAWLILPDTLNNADGLRQIGSSISLTEYSERRLALDFADPEISLEQLKQRHEHWLRAFPKAAAGGGKDGVRRRAITNRLYRYRKAVTGRLAQLEQTLQSITAAQGSTRSTDQELLLQLGHARATPPRARGRQPRPITKHVPSSKPSIQSRIVGLDLAAVPMLLEAMKSSDLTRCARTDANPMTFLTVRELAHELLERIAGYAATGDASRSKWQAWHENVQTNGLRKVIETELKQGNFNVISPYLKRWPKQWPRVITLIEPPETNITGVVAMLRGLPKQLPRQALVASERVLAAKTNMLFKQMVAAQLAVRTAPNGENALKTVLKNKSIDAKTRKEMSRLLPR
jgi:hypothetical protein